MSETVPNAKAKNISQISEVNRVYSPLSRGSTVESRQQQLFTEAGAHRAKVHLEPLMAGLNLEKTKLKREKTKK